MKTGIKKGRGIVKGAPSGFVLSLMVHAAAFMLAGMLVVFNVVKKEEKKFVPPKPVERPKMKLKKPKVKVKKSAKPKSTQRIVTKVKRASMPDLQLPEMSGLGDGLAGGMAGGFDLMPDLEEVTMFGGSTSIGNDLEGTLYDFKRFRNGRTSGVLGADGLISAVEKFIRSGWKESSVAKYYRSPKKLYSPMIVVPPTESALGTWAFGERDMGPWAFMLHYKGQLIHQEGIKFRFVAMADNYLVIRVNGKVVLDYKNQFEAAVSSPPSKPLSYHLGHWYAYGSEWIELEPGVPQDVEFIFGEYSGVLTATMVAVEEYGVDYPRTPMPQDNPQLPIFKTARLSADQIDAIYQRMWPGHLDVEGGPIFNDYDSGGVSTDSSIPKTETVAQVEPEPVKPAVEKSSVRPWTLTSGKILEAEFVNLMGGQAVLKTTRGKMLKVLPSDLSEADREELQLLNPPKLKLNFKKDTKQFVVQSNPEMNNILPAAIEFAGGVEIEQEDRKNDYQRPLKLEFYLIADEYDGDNFILFDRQFEEFTLTAENEWKFGMMGRTDVMLRYEHYAGNVRGEKYKGYMILVLNERDEIIAQNLSHSWLLDIRENLKKLPVGRHFNKEGERVHPPRPLFTDQYWEHEP